MDQIHHRLRRSIPGGRALAALLSGLVIASLLTGCGGDGEASTQPAAGGRHSGKGPAQQAKQEEKAEDAIAVRVLPVAVEPLSSIYSTSATLRADKQAEVTARTTGCGGDGEASTQPAAAGRHSGKGPAQQAKQEEKAEDAIAVRVLPVAVEPLSSIYSTSATLRADKQAEVTARTTGVIRRITVEEGDRVEEGAPLAFLEDEEQKIEFERTSTVRGTLVLEYERARRLHDQQLMSEEEFEATRRNWEEAIHANDLAKLLLSRTVIRAPFSGRILRRHVDPGATVNDGTPVYDLADLDPLYADVNVPEKQVVRLSPGQRVRLAGDPTVGVTPARIERIAPVVDSATGTVKVTLAVDGSSELRPGSFTRVEIVTDTHDDALVVPRSALVAEGRRWHLFRVTSDGSHVERLEVTRGYEEGDKVEILETIAAESPLNRGDRVVVVGASALTDGAVVDVAKPEGPDGEPDEAARVAA